jgi:hypothetical protein
MKKDTYKDIFRVILLTGIILISGCENKKGDTNGFLEGTISIGPICPVEKFPPDPACQPTAETYKAYPVSVFTTDGVKKVIQLSPSPDGSYNTELPTGNYVINLDKQISIGGSNLPIEISITSQNHTVVNINIDTGIR